MINIKGEIGEAIVFNNDVEQSAISQIYEMCNNAISKDSKIRIMPDVHAGAGCVIGTTMTITDKIVPNIVGVDIGCGMSYIKIEQKDIDLDKLDKTIKELIPCGHNIHEKENTFIVSLIDRVKCSNNFNRSRALRSLGTLGGGNHFIEVSKDRSDDLWVIVHSGSRKFGMDIALYYQKLAESMINDNRKSISEYIEFLKTSGVTGEELGSKIDEIKNKYASATKTPKHLCYLTKENMNNYLHDMNIAQQYASINRAIILDKIRKNMGFRRTDSDETIHNYIDLDTMILRKGAVSARKDERLLIPMNMSYGSLLCRGKGNADWNYSAPHGAGRLFGRAEAKRTISLDEFKKSMSGVYSSCITESTIDESPMAYKNPDNIIANISETVEILDVLKPIYNFKASEE